MGNGEVRPTRDPTQAEPEVRCHYNLLSRPRRGPDLRILVGKAETIYVELGSLASVVMDRLATVMEDGTGETTGAALDVAVASERAPRRRAGRAGAAARRHRPPPRRDKNELIARSSANVMDLTPHSSATSASPSPAPARSPPPI